VLQLSGNHTAQPPQESLFQGAGKEAPADCRTSSFRKNNVDSVLAVEWWTSSLPLQGCSGGHGSLPIQSPCALWTWRRLMTVSPWESCWGYYGSMGYRGRWYKPFGPCTTKVRAVYVFSAQSSTFSVGVELCQGCPLSQILFVIFMNRISRCSRVEESVRFGDLSIASLLFVDDLILLTTSDRDLQHALGRFAAECEAVGMRVSTSKSEAMVLCRKMVECSLWVGSQFA